MSSAWRRLGAGVAVGLAVAGLGLAPVLVDSTPARADQVRDLEYWLNDYGFTQAWATSKGAGVKVAIIDTGVAGGVADLAGAVVGGTDVSGLGTPNGQTPVGEGSEHGTLVASLLAGRGTGTDAGIIGVAPEASILSVSLAFGSSGATVSNDDQIAEGIRWAVDNGASVINMSLTRNTLDWPESWDSAFLYAFEHDVVVVAAAGNRGSGTTEVGAPATIPGVLAVAGVNRNKTASFDASSQGITISVAAPSEKLVGAVPAGGYVQWSGTSAAAPIVSGLVALVRSAYPELDAAGVMNRIIATADPNGREVPSPIYGNGLINAAAAVTATVPAAAGPTPTALLKDWIHLHRRADTTPTPTPTPTAAAPIQPREDPSLPPWNKAAVWLPNQHTLTYVSIPLAVLLGFGILVTLFGTGATRHFRRIRRES
ncbi:type VII secretion-associated serine protease mycosin [Cryobacterium psychrotolerans]|uniref:Type VII secretion-associated serine protease mycosin n=1 Tax=Cryobacterium psychrotolerans TaxID=386301 RepID=A0A1G8XIM7_9MICO|nr:S8 family serine peptidase [Cryobacterium psychrotolerans]TFD82896.1 peptidase S8 [Cryobacterium psychrotolerans]SDJ90391.1 type VII secretion-associated serine protease mycosin [Cryobacterium psychrotolerans]